MGIDKDHDLFRLSGALLQIASKSRGRVFNFNSLDHAQWSGTTGNDSFDVVLTNPPFGTKIGVRDERVLQQFALGRQWVLRESEDEWHQTLAVAGAQGLRIRDLVFVQSTLGTLGKRLLELRVPLLHGEGPWKERVHQFRRTLQERDRLLSELKVTAGCDYEL